jgi:Skp family chaperone for outer membrane proteins
MAIDSEYVKEAVGDILPLALRATVAAQPHDPVDYLGKWMLRYLDHQEGMAWFKDYSAKFQDEKKKCLAELELERKRLQEERRKKEEDARRLAEEERLAEEAARKRRRAEEEEEEEDRAKPPKPAEDADESYEGSGSGA